MEKDKIYFLSVQSNFDRIQKFKMIITRRLSSIFVLYCTVLYSSKRVQTKIVDTDYFNLTNKIKINNMVNLAI